jgi:hypothetical protein
MKISQSTQRFFMKKCVHRNVEQHALPKGKKRIDLTAD